MAAYIALLEHASGLSYGVFFPDLPGCVSGGDTAEEAMHKAQGALRLHLKGMLEDKEVIPAPTSVETIVANPEYAGLVPFLVEVPLEQSKPIRLNISLDERLVKEIDTFASSRGLTRSGFLAAAAREMMQSAE